jgi:hypothetical protein
MRRQVVLAGSALALALALVAVTTPGHSEGKATPRKAIAQDRVVAGGPRDFLEVRHLVLRGSNQEIGQALATLAQERYRLGPTASTDRFRTRVQRRYIERNYPFLLERMRGVAAAFDRSLTDDAWNFGGLWYPGGLLAGCSVVHFPPGVTATGTGIVSRDYDFSTGTLHGTRPRRGELAATARPYVIEMYPDRGHASLAICAYDLLSGVLDGINSEGLTVALLADDELLAKFPMEPAGEDGVGLGVVQTLRFLLDTCATVEEAKEALLLTKQYYELVPVHYLIADRHGKSFVWEYSQSHNREYIVENPGKPLVTTNFSLHRYLEGKGPPSAKGARKVCPRYCALAERIAGRSGKLTVPLIKDMHRAVDATRPSPKGAARPPLRTLWHALYFPEQRQVQVSFYLGDEADPDRPGKTRIRRSDYLEFKLKGGKVSRGKP